MNLLHMNLGILDGVFSWMLNLVNEVIGALFILIINLFNLVFGAAMFMIASILGALTDFFQGVFKSLAGVGTYWQGRNPMPNGSDPVFAMITSDVIWKTFLIMLAIAFVLVILMSIVAIIRNEYNTDKANNTKGGVLGAAVKSIAFFAITPVVTVFGILGCNMLLRVLDTATGGQDTSVSGQVFAASAYGANYMRIEDQFAQFDGLGTIAQGLVEGMNRLFALTNYGDADTAKNSFYHLNNTLYDPSWYGQEGGKEKIAASVDAAFAEGMVIKETEAFKGLQAAAAANGLTSVILGGQTSLISGLVSGIGSANLTRLQWTNAPVVAMYYRLSDINYIVLIGGMVMALYVMYTAAFGLIMRLYKCTMLFMVSPPIIALGPMDNMSAFGNWRKQFVGQALSAYGVVIGMNLAFKLIAVTNNINLFDPTSAAGMAGNMLVHALMSITALFMMKDFIKMVSGFVGGEEASSAGADIAKKVTKTGLAVGAVALTGGAAASVGAMKGLGATGKLIGKGAKGLGSKLYHAGEIKAGPAGSEEVVHKNLFAKGADTAKRFGSLAASKARVFGNRVLDAGGKEDGSPTRRRRGWNKLKAGGSAVSGFVHDNVTSEQAKEKQKLRMFNMASKGFGAIKGAGSAIGLDPLFGGIGNIFKKPFEGIGNNLKSSIAIQNIKEQRATEFKANKLSVESAVSDAHSTDRINKLNLARDMTSYLEDLNSTDNKKRTGAEQAFSDQMEYLGLKDKYKDADAFRNNAAKDIQALKVESLNTDSINAALSKVYGMSEEKAKNLDYTQKVQLVEGLDVLNSMNEKQFAEMIGKGIKGDGKGGLTLDKDAMADIMSKFYNAGKSESQKISNESVSALASAISHSIGGELSKMSDKIIESAKGEDLTNLTMKQLLDEMKGMREDLKSKK